METSNQIRVLIGDRSKHLRRQDPGRFRQVCSWSGQEQKFFHVFSSNSQIFAFTVDFHVEYVGDTESENHELK